MSNENLWFKKVIPAGVRHLVSRPLEKQVLKQTRVPAPYVPGRYPPGINLYGLFKAEIGLSEGVKESPTGCWTWTLCRSCGRRTGALTIG